MNLFEFFRNQPHWLPDRTALRETATGRRWTYADLDAASARLARRLNDEFLVAPGDRVAVQVEKTPEAFLLYLGCLRAGAVFLPLNTAYTATEVEFFLSDARPSLFVTDPRREGEFSSLGRNLEIPLTFLDASGRGTLTAELERLPPHAPSIATKSEDLAAILYTSGTTGRSKGAMITHGNLASNAEALASAWGFSSDDRLLHALPIYHVHGLFISLHCVLARGAQAIWLPRFDAESVCRALADATVFMGVPTYYTRLLECAEFTRERTQGVRLFVSGSAPLRPETFAEFEARTGHRILERYGMTETGINSSNPLTGERRAGSVGLPLPQVELRLGEGDVIEVRGPNVFSGYWQRPELTRSEFTADGFFRTGDVGVLDPDGYLRIVGRAKDLIITGGFNVYPKEIETVLDSIVGVAESAVVGIPHPDFGEAVVAVVVRAQDEAGRALTESALQTTARQQLAGFKVPKRVHFVESLPRNAMGKVQKNLLREWLAKEMTHDPLAKKIKGSSG